MDLTKSIVLATLGTAALMLSACTTQPSRSTQADGSYCHRIGKSYSPKLTCTDSPVPSEVVEQRAKQFEPTPGAITLYVVRSRWGDPVNKVPVVVDGLEPVLTIPQSLIRLRLKPGQHRITVDWEGKQAIKTITGGAGDVVFVELAGSVWSWGSTYQWVEPQGQSARKSATSAKLIADVDLRL
jgi:hypothetical protein